MKFQLNASEHADWQEVWCWRCKNDHEFSHIPGQEDEGCPLIADGIMGEDVAEFAPIRKDWWFTIPASVTCSAFEVCTLCPAESPDAERRGGETRREFYDRLRTEMLATPVETSPTPKEQK
jgi:hypothetical protein